MVSPADGERGSVGAWGPAGRTPPPRQPCHFLLPPLFPHPGETVSRRPFIFIFSLPPAAPSVSPAALRRTPPPAKAPLGAARPPPGPAVRYVAARARRAAAGTSAAGGEVRAAAWGLVAASHTPGPDSVGGGAPLGLCSTPVFYQRAGVSRHKHAVGTLSNVHHEVHAEKVAPTPTDNLFPDQ